MSGFVCNCAKCVNVKCPMYIFPCSKCDEKDNFPHYKEDLNRPIKVVHHRKTPEIDNLGDFVIPGL